MSDAFDTMGLVLVICLPIGAYLLAARDPRRTRGQLLAASTLGGAAAGLIVAAAIALRAPSLQLALEAWPYAAIMTVQGLLIGALALVARAVGDWLRQRP